MTTLDPCAGVLGLRTAFPARNFFVFNRLGAASVVGTVYQLDLADGDNKIVVTRGSQVAGSPTEDVTCNIVTPTALGDAGIFVVAQQAVADDKMLLVSISGVLDVLCVTAVNQGDPLECDGTSALVICTNDGAYQIGWALEDNDTGGSLNCKVLFNGMGMGGASVVS